MTLAGGPADELGVGVPARDEDQWAFFTRLGQRAVWLSVACLGLVAAVPLSAQQPRLRDTLGRGDQGAVESVAFSPDGKTLASGSSAQTIKLWELGYAK